MENRVHEEKITAYYENRLQSGAFSPFERIGFINVGYWKGVDDNLEIAQINLIETLARFFHNKEGTVLDAACGRGAACRASRQLGQNG